VRREIFIPQWTLRSAPGAYATVKLNVKWETVISIQNTAGVS